MQLGARLRRCVVAAVSVALRGMGGAGAGECYGDGGGLTSAGVAGLAAVMERVGGGGSVVDGGLGDGP